MSVRLMGRAAIAAAGICAAALVGACGSSDETTPTQSSVAPTSSTDEGSIQPVGSIIRGQSGATVELQTVTQRGASTVLGVKFTAGRTNLEGYNILTPVLTYGQDGKEAAVDYAITEPVSGIIPAGTARSVEFGYEVDKAKLNPATVTIGIGLAEAGWHGDLTTVKAAPAESAEPDTPAAAEVPATTETPAPEPAPTEESADAPPATFDPDSGDGYGPNQKLPPLCERFPDEYGPC
ncbi:hypothetical protein [Gordonia sihwensis]|uniref:hypothetical protein n=1 Tax=Gordonia sihwensis TaxID=173559 RepID=UPI0024176CA6|nr:hypothetical protein [Gordonia sihwensis]WFN94191.1 hypothetical protein P5P27_06490 [Gordonia sihwensis]WFN94252.1 hypothetical protein P5P27_06800 [Gordonia sihwensis]